MEKKKMKPKNIDQEREKYELNIQEMQESHDKLTAEQANGQKNRYLQDDYFQSNKHFSYFVELCKIKAANERELDSLKQQLAEKDTLMDQIRSENETAKLEVKIETSYT